MFFVLSKVFGLLLLPLPLFGILSFVWILVKIPGGRNKFFGLLPYLLLWILGTRFPSQAMVRTLEDPYPPIPMESVPNKDVAIVLGGMVNTLIKNPSHAELTEASDRLIDAIRLYKKGKVKKILFTGGSGSLHHQDITESQIARLIFLDLGVPEEDLILEDKSRNTYENALYSKELLDKTPWKSYILITSASHMKRSEAVFQKAGFQDLFLFPTDYRSLREDLSFWDKILPSPGSWELLSVSSKEWIGIWVYSWKGYL